MSSVQSFFAQPKTRCLAVTQGEWGAYFYAQSDIDAWYAANESKITKTGDLYVIPGTAEGSTFLDVLLGNNGATALDHTLPRIEERKTIVDFGKQVIIGNAANSRLLVLRLVQQYSDAAVSGGAAVGYVVVENNVDDLQGNNGRFTLRVARV
jgi:Ca2+-binding RTX toxin-like protein